MRRFLRLIASRVGLTTPPPGHVRFGDLRRTTPFSREFGYDRGLPVDRYYIERFLERHAGDVHGRVLEIGGDAYTRRFGGERVAHSDVLHVHDRNPRATIVGDLADAPHIPSELFDCLVITQTLQLIFDPAAAIRTMHRILKPGGVCLLTVPGITQLHTGEWGATWYWSFTRQSVRRLFAEQFPGARVDVETHGNVLATSAFLYGLAAQDLRTEELDATDECYQAIIAVRAVKAATPA